MEKIILLAILTLSLTGWIAHRTELDVGRVINDQGDGKLYNGEAYYNYIAYPDRYGKDDVILTICFLNPLNNYCDDILIRHDIRLLKNTKEGRTT